MRSGSNIIILDSKNRILLQQREDKPEISGPGGWGLWGGTAFPRETPVECAMRELYEETGIRAEKDDLIFVTDTRGLDRRDLPLTISLFFLNFRVEGPIALGEGKGYGFFSKDDALILPSGMGPNTRKLFIDFVDNFDQWITK